MSQQQLSVTFNKTTLNEAIKKVREQITEQSEYVKKTFGNDRLGLINEAETLINSSTQNHNLEQLTSYLESLVSMRNNITLEIERWFRQITNDVERLSSEVDNYTPLPKMLPVVAAKTKS